MKEKVTIEIKKDLINLLKYKTIKDNIEGINSALNYIKEELKEYNVEEVIVGKYKNIIISNTKEKDLDVIFCGHIDVVPNDNYDYYEKEGKIFGRGTFDMKGQISVLMSLLKYNVSNKKIALIITSDEEIGGYCCKEIVKDYNSKLAVIPDGGKNFDLIIEEKGLLQLELKMKGITAHASEPYKGDNPIIALVKLYEKLVEKYNLPNSAEDFKTSINLSKLNGGDAVNMVPGFASMVLDIRFTKEDSIDDIINTIKSYSKEVEIKILDHGPIFQVDPNLPIIKQFIKDSSKILKRDVNIKKCVATSDAIYFSEKNIPTILMNPIGNYWHNPKEYVLLESLYTLYEIFITLI